VVERNLVAIVDDEKAVRRHAGADPRRFQVIHTLRQVVCVKG
jgi:hypothetical protein